MADFKLPQARSRAEALRARQLEADLWLADGPHSELIFTSHQGGRQRHFACGATEDPSFQVVVGCHGNRSILMLRIIGSKMKMASLERKINLEAVSVIPSCPRLCVLCSPPPLTCLEVLILMIYEVSARRSCALPHSPIKRQMYDRVIHKYPGKLCEASVNNKCFILQSRLGEPHPHPETIRNR